MEAKGEQMRRGWSTDEDLAVEATDEEDLKEIFVELLILQEWVKIRRELGLSYDLKYHFFKCCEIGNYAFCNFLLDHQFISPTTKWNMLGGYQIGEEPAAVAERNGHFIIVELLLKHKEIQRALPTEESPLFNLEKGAENKNIDDDLIEIPPVSSPQQKTRFAKTPPPNDRPLEGRPSSRNRKRLSKSPKAFQKMKRSKSGNVNQLKTVGWRNLLKKEPSLIGSSFFADPLLVSSTNSTISEFDDWSHASRLVADLSSDSEDDQYEFAMSAFAKIYTESFKYLEKRIGEAKEQETKEELERYFLFLEDVIDQVLPSALHAFLATDFMPGFDVGGSTRLAKKAARGKLAKLFLDPNMLTQLKGIEDFDLENADHPGYVQIFSFEAPSSVSVQDIYDLFVKLFDEDESELILFLHTLKLPVLQLVKDEKTGFGLLHAACAKGKFLLTRKLIEIGLRANSRTIDGRLPLHLMLNEGCKAAGIVPAKEEDSLMPLFNLLLRDVRPTYAISKKKERREDETYQSGDTLLHTAVRARSLRLVSKLLPNSKLGKRNVDGVLALELAIGIEDERAAREMVKLMLPFVKKKTLATHGNSLQLAAIKQNRPLIYSVIKNALLTQFATVYALPGAPNCLPDLEEQDPLLMFSSEKRHILQLCLDLNTNILFLKRILGSYHYWISVLDLVDAVSIITTRLPIGTGLEPASRFFFVLSESSTTDFKIPAIRKKIRTLLSGLTPSCGEKGEFYEKLNQKLNEVNQALMALRLSDPSGLTSEFQMEDLPFFKAADNYCVQDETQPDLDQYSNPFAQAPSDYSSSPFKPVSKRVSLLNRDSIHSLADHLFLWCYQLQRCCPAAELCAAPIAAQCNQSGPHLNAITTLLNDIVRWVGTNILSFNRERDRADVIEAVIRLLLASHEKQNYYASMALSLGLQETYISRLKKSWKLVDPELNAELVDIIRLFKPTKNFAALRRQIANSSGAFVAYLGIPIRDLIYLNDSNATLVGPTQSSLNVWKFSQMFDVVQNWHLRSYSDGVEPPLSEMDHQICKYLTCINECAKDIPPELLKKLSLALEPPQGSREKVRTMSPKDQIILREIELRKLKDVLPHFETSSFCQFEVEHESPTLSTISSPPSFGRLPPSEWGSERSPSPLRIPDTSPKTKLKRIMPKKTPPSSKLGQLMS